MKTSKAPAEGLSVRTTKKKIEKLVIFNEPENYGRAVDLWIAKRMHDELANKINEIIDFINKL